MASFLIIDGNSIINRAFFGQGRSGQLTAPDGTPTGAVYTFLTMFLRYYNEYQPSHIAVAFDRPEPTFRHKQYDGYKATRTGMPEDLAVQMPILKSFLEALRIPTLELVGYEADDIIGTLSHQYASEELPVYILSGDRDDFQLLTPWISQLYPQTRGETTVYTPALLEEKYGIRPDQIVDLKALMGDSSDCIPGVKGVGEKTAVKLLQTYDTLEQILASADALEGSVGKKIRDGIDDALMSQKLAQIDKHVPIDSQLNDFEIKPWDQAKLLAQFKSLGFTSMISRFGLEESSVDDSLMGERQDWLWTMCADHSKLSKSLTITEIPVFVSCKQDELSNWSVVFGQSRNHEELWGIDKISSEDLAGLFGQIQDRGHVLISYDWKEILKSLEFFPLTNLVDLSVAGYLAGLEVANQSWQQVYGLILEKNWQDVVAFPEPSKQDSNSEVFLSLINENLAYSDLYRKVEEVLEEKQLLELAQTMEYPLVSVLAAMENYGVKVDPKLLEVMGEDFRKQAAVLEQRIFTQAGREFNINSPKQLGEVLFAEMGISKGKKTSTGAYSTAASELEKLAPFYPIVEDILAYRKVTKLDSTFIQGLAKEIQEDGRVHTTFNQTLTATGRLSSTAPNLQNIPMREDEGRKIRQAFVAKPGYVFIDADYSQIELRLLAILSEDPNLLEAFLNQEDIHVRTAGSIFSIPEDQVQAWQRSAAKTVNFSIVYGISDFGLAQDLKISRQEAHQYIEGYHRLYPGVKPYMESLVEFGKEHGYVETYFGRRRYIPELQAKNFNVRNFGERAAMNAPVQGTAADVMKIAMLNIYKAIQEEKLDAHLLIQVHDEILLEAAEKDQDRVVELLRTAMEEAADFSIPLKCEIKTGPNWYESK